MLLAADVSSGERNKAAEYKSWAFWQYSEEF
jgi:GH25 family lysozyme M1 (1,4-beta-N-acetylmuramidase)